MDEESESERGRDTEREDGETPDTRHKKQEPTIWYQPPELKNRTELNRRRNRPEMN